MQKYMTIVVLRKSILGTFISYVDSILVKDPEETKYILQSNAESHIRDCIEKFPEFDKTQFEISFHTNYN